VSYFFFQAEDGIRDRNVTGVQTCALPISQDRGDVHLALAEYQLLPGVALERSVLEMGELHPLSQPLEQRGRIRAADRAPEGVQLEHHPRIEVIDQHLQAAPTVEDRAG